MAAGIRPSRRVHAPEISGRRPQASHESWMDQKIADGWIYGKVKNQNLVRPTHPCIVPFDQLPREQQAKDYIFRAVVHALA